MKAVAISEQLNGEELAESISAAEMAIPISGMEKHQCQ